MENFVILPAPQQLVWKHYHLTIVGDNQGSGVADMNDYVVAVMILFSWSNADLLIMDSVTITLEQFTRNYYDFNLLDEGGNYSFKTIVASHRFK